MVHLSGAMETPIEKESFTLSPGKYVTVFENTLSYRLLLPTFDNTIFYDAFRYQWMYAHLNLHSIYASSFCLFTSLFHFVAHSNHCRSVVSCTLVSIESDLFRQIKIKKAFLFCANKNV